MTSFELIKLLWPVKKSQPSRNPLAYETTSKRSHTMHLRTLVLKIYHSGQPSNHATKELFQTPNWEYVHKDI